MSARRTFQGVLEKDGTALGWTVVRVPFEPAVVWARRRGLRVRGTICCVTTPARSPAREGFAFRTSLFRSRTGGCILLVNERMQKAAGVTLGSVAEVVLEPDIEERPAQTSPELEKLLRQDRALRTWHDALSP
ncbi:MAG TPA: DUF1905 domain-containing protein [Acidobacteriaceae bacterium]|jgi:hypothetical protein|nr:DUF1905 domain-containing protein [Acidobacteriaceae bacterium]